MGLRVSSNLNKSFNWLEWANPNTFDTREEVEKYMEETVGWNKHRNQNQDPNSPILKHKYITVIELTDEEIEYWTRVMESKTKNKKR